MNLKSWFPKIWWPIKTVWQSAGVAPVLRPDYSVGSKLSKEEWCKQHDEVSKTIWSVGSLSVATCVFCLVTLGAPDQNLLSSDATINIPVANTQVSFTGFLFLAPLILMALNLYLQVFSEQRLRLGPPGERPCLPLVFNLNIGAADLMSAFVLYVMTPLVLVAFTWKALPRRDAPILLLATCLFTASMALLAVRRFDAWRTGPRPWLDRVVWRMLWAGLVVCAALAVPLVPASLSVLLADPLTGPQPRASQRTLAGALMPTRRLQLFGASLVKKNLIGLYAPYSDLRKADLRESDLEGAILAYSDIRKADLTSANLNGTDLTKVRLDDSTKIEIKWRLVACVMNENLTSDCMQRQSLEWADLSHANLEGVKLEKAVLSGVNLRGANLSHAELKGANLRLADLREAVLPPDMGSVNLGGAILPANSKSTTLAAVAVRIENRVTQSCLLAPSVPEPGGRIEIGREYPCTDVSDARAAWGAKRLPRGFITLRSLVPAAEMHCLDGTAFNTEGRALQTWPCSDDFQNQWWHIFPESGGYVLLEKRGTNFCLHGTGGRNGGNAPFLAECDPGSHDQHWRLIYEPAKSGARPRLDPGPQRRLDLEAVGQNYLPSPWFFSHEFNYGNTYSRAPRGSAYSSGPYRF